MDDPMMSTGIATAIDAGPDGAPTPRVVIRVAVPGKQPGMMIFEPAEAIQFAADITEAAHKATADFDLFQYLIAKMETDQAGAIGFLSDLHEFRGTVQRTRTEDGTTTERLPGITTVDPAANPEARPIPGLPGWFTASEN